MEGEEASGFLTFLVEESEWLNLNFPTCLTDTVESFTSLIGGRLSLTVENFNILAETEGFFPATFEYTGAAGTFSIFPFFKPELGLGTWLIAIYL